jgi:hypothetical protein
METTRTRAKARQGSVSWQQAQDKFIPVRSSRTPVNSIQVPPSPRLSSSLPPSPSLPCLIHSPPLLDPLYSPPLLEIHPTRHRPVPQLTLLLEAMAQLHYPQASRPRWLPYVSQVSPSVLASHFKIVDGKPGFPISRCRRCYCDIQARQPRCSYSYILYSRHGCPP